MKACLSVTGGPLTGHELTAGGLKYPTGCPYQGPAEHGCVEIKLISGKSSLDPHSESIRLQGGGEGQGGSQPHSIDESGERKQL